MTGVTDGRPEAIRKQVRVAASAERAFRVFTEEFDSWWPRSHHIGRSPLVRAVIEGRVGGRCYGAQEDGTDCVWGTVLSWDPPRRFSFAWQINADWTFQPDLARSSEVVVTFTPAADGTTLVELEHRHFERHGAGSATMRGSVGGEGGWGSLLQRYAALAGHAA